MFAFLFGLSMDYEVVADVTDCTGPPSRDAFKTSPTTTRAARATHARHLGSGCAASARPARPALGLGEAVAVLAEDAVERWEVEVVVPGSAPTPRARAIWLMVMSPRSRTVLTYF
jgi:hypothetical protein